MFISQQYIFTLWYICANLIENESLVTPTDLQNQSDSGHICKNPPVQLNYRLNSSFWKYKSLPKLQIRSFSLLLIIAMHRGSSFFSSITEIEHASC